MGLAAKLAARQAVGLGLGLEAVGLDAVGLEAVDLGFRRSSVLSQRRPQGSPTLSA